MTYELERLAKIQAAAADDRETVIVGDDVDLYQAEALRFAFYPRVDDGAPVYPALAMLGEIGELAEAIEAERGQRSEYILSERMLYELGDILWYVAAWAKDIGWNLSVVVGANEWTDVPASMNRLSMERWALRLVARAGRLSEQCAKKPWRDGTAVDRPLAARLLLECVQAVDAITDCCGTDIGRVAQMNINKLVSRRKRGKLTGSGDNR